MITSEFRPIRYRQSSVAILENKKWNYSIQDDAIMLSSKKMKICQYQSPMENVDKLGQQELCALLFGILRAIEKSYKMKTEPVLV